MNKDKQIEEMARDLKNHTCMSEFQAEIASRMLYTKGYRKADEVAKEIFEEIDKVLNFYKRNNPFNDLLKAIIEKYTELKKKYTEENNGNS